jgi:hypothetical protein
MSARGAAPVGDRARFTGLLVLLCVLLLATVLAGVVLGPVSLPVTDTLAALAAHFVGGTTRPGDAIVWEVRTPRVLLRAVAGAGLSATGVAVRALVRNALADPYLLGVSSGASVGATAVLLSGALAGLGTWALTGGAFFSALVAVFAVFALARTAGAGCRRCVSCCRGRRWRRCSRRRRASSSTWRRPARAQGRRSSGCSEVWAGHRGRPCWFRSRARGGSVVASGDPSVLGEDLVQEVFGVRPHVITHPSTGRPQLLFPTKEFLCDS